MHGHGRHRWPATSTRLADAAGVLVAALLLTGCVSTTKGAQALELTTREQMTQTLTSAARQAIAATGIELTYASITYSSCAGDGVSSPTYGIVNAGFDLPDTPAEAEAQVDAWAEQLVAAGWTQTPPGDAQDAQVHDRVFAKDGVALLLTPWAKSYSPPPNVFTVRSDCAVDTDGRPRPEDADLLPAITGR